MNGQEAAVMTKGWPSNNSAPKPLRTARPVESTPHDATHTLVRTLSILKESEKTKIQSLNFIIFYDKVEWTLILKT